MEPLKVDPTKDHQKTLLKAALACQPSWLQFFSFLGSKKDGIVLMFLKGNVDACYAIQGQDVEKVLKTIIRAAEDFLKNYDKEPDLSNGADADRSL